MKLKIKNLLHSNDGKMNPSVINFAIIGLIMLVVLFTIYSVLIPEAQTAGNSLNASLQCTSNNCFFNASGSPNATIGTVTCLEGSENSNVSCSDTTTNTNIPLAGLFSGTGVVFVVIMAALIILVVRAYLKSQK